MLVEYFFARLHVKGEVQQYGMYCEDRYDMYDQLFVTLLCHVCVCRSIFNIGQGPGKQQVTSTAHRLGMSTALRSVRATSFVRALSRGSRRPTSSIAKLPNQGRSAQVVRMVSTTVPSETIAKVRQAASYLRRICVRCLVVVYA